MKFTLLSQELELISLNAEKPAQPKSDGALSIEQIRLASSAIDTIDEQEFSAYLFQTGTFWEQSRFENSLNENSSPYFYLLDHLMKARKKFLSSPDLKLLPETIDKLFVTSILIKFFGRKKGMIMVKVLLITYIRSIKFKNFTEAVRAGYCIDIFNELANEFNGRIFDKFSVDEKKLISKSDLTSLGNFLEFADVDIDTFRVFYGNNIALSIYQLR